LAVIGLFPKRRNAMTIEELEARVKALEELTKSQALEIRTLKDIEEIGRLQKAYGYYLEHWMTREIVDLFSDSPDISLTLAPGTYLGKAGVTKYFEHNKPDNEFLHQVMQLSGIVDVAPDGNTAKGRWYGFGAIALPAKKGMRQSFMGGIYICEYIKEQGVWKFKKLQFDMVYTAKPLEGWVKPERLAEKDSSQPLPAPQADLPRTYTAFYPSGYIVPFHYKHPVTGKKTSENDWNSLLKGASV
jgi:hypothetical protein